MKALVRSRYKNSYGEPFELTDGQAEIFEVIARRMYPRVHCMTYTQFGKSDTVSLAVLTRVTTFAEKWAIVAPSNKKARIIMSYLIGHIFDNEFTVSLFDIGKGESIDRIRRERSKDRITFNIPEVGIGEVFIISSEGKRTKDLLDALLGYGAQNIVVDESSLIDDLQHVGILRMLGGHKDNFLFEIGNPMRRNHFYKASFDPNYHRINIDYHRGIAEGRITQSFVNEMKGKPFFEQLYENKFPAEDGQDLGGYSPLVSESFIESRKRTHVDLFGELKMGCDVAGEGSNFSVIVLRGRNGAKVVYRKNNPDTMNFAAIIAETAKKFNVKSSSVFIDKIGVGKGVYDRLKELKETKDVVGVQSGEKAQGADFMNKRAEMFWRLKEWAATAELEGDGWEDLLDVKYKVQSDKKVKIKSKDEMLKEGIQSPDVADSLAMTFYEYDSQKTDVFYSDYEQPDYESPGLST